MTTSSLYCYSLTDSSPPKVLAPYAPYIFLDREPSSSLPLLCCLIILQVFYDLLSRSGVSELSHMVSLDFSAMVCRNVRCVVPMGVIFFFRHLSLAPVIDQKGNLYMRFYITIVLYNRISLKKVVQYLGFLF